MIANEEKEKLTQLGYTVAASTSHPGCFRWWRNTESDGESAPKKELSEVTFETEDGAWTAAKMHADIFVRPWNLVDTDSEGTSNFGLPRHFPTSKE